MTAAAQDFFERRPEIAGAADAVRGRAKAFGRLYEIRISGIGADQIAAVAGLRVAPDIAEAPVVEDAGHDVDSVANRGGAFLSQKYSAVGCSFPIALGAKLAAPDRPVVCIEGDGGLHCNVTELATAVMEKIPVVLIVMNDGHLNANRQIAGAFFDGKQVWTKLNNPDWIAVAKAFGAGGERVEDPDDIPSALRRGLSSNLPYVIDMIVDPDVRCPITGKLWKIRW